MQYIAGKLWSPDKLIHIDVFGSSSLIMAEQNPCIYQWEMSLPASKSVDIVHNSSQAVRRARCAHIFTRTLYLSFYKYKNETAEELVSDASPSNDNRLVKTTLCSASPSPGQ